MKRLVVIALFVGFIIPVLAQGINVGVVVPNENRDGVNQSVFNMLSTKLERMITTGGACSVNGGDIVLFPVFDYTSDEVIEGGMRNINSVNFDLTVKVISISGHTTFGIYTWSLKGKGFSKSEAVRDAVNSLNTNDVGFAIFLTGVKTKMEKFFISNRKSMIAQAKTLATQKQYEKAIALLYAYPSSLSGYSEVLSAMNTIYKQYQRDNCSQVLQQARAMFATHDYEEAQALIYDLDASSPCAKEAKTLTNQIRQQINSDIAAERADAVTRMKIAADIEKSRINAFAYIVSSYYKYHPYSYDTLITVTWD